MIYASPASKFKPPSTDEPDPSLVYSIAASVKHAGTPDQYLVLRMLGSTQCTTLVSRMLDGATLRHEIACHNDHATSGARTIVTVCARSATALLSMDSAESANSARNLSSTCP